MVFGQNFITTSKFNLIASAGVKEIFWWRKWAQRVSGLHRLQEIQDLSTNGLGVNQPLGCKTRILVIFAPPFYRKLPVGKPMGALLSGSMAKTVYIVINLRLS